MTQVKKEGGLAFMFNELIYFNILTHLFIFLPIDSICYYMVDFFCPYFLVFLLLFGRPRIMDLSGIRLHILL